MQRGDLQPYMHLPNHSTFRMTVVERSHSSRLLYDRYLDTILGLAKIVVRVLEQIPHITSLIA